MKLSKKIIKSLVLVVFVFSFGFYVNIGQSANEQQSYEEGKLIKVKGRQGAAVYQIGSDGKKYVFPDAKTYGTWHDDFSQVEEVELAELDNYDDGGIVTVQPGSKLITHPNTAKVYAVGEGGELFHIPDEATAEKLYGEGWSKNVEDVDPGIFSTSYTNTQEEVSEENLPEGTLVNEEETDELFLIQDGKKREVKPYAYGQNNLDKKSVVKVKQIKEKYELGEELKMPETRVSQYNPIEEDETFVVICHQPITSNANNPQTMKISQKALEAHLNHGDALGECPDQEYPEPEDTCDNVVVDTRSAAGGTAWQDLGLDISAHPTITRYRIQWFSGYWSPWYTKGVDDIDWVDPNRRVWSYFDDHTHQVEWCQTINDDMSDITCAGGEDPELIERERLGNTHWNDLGLDISTHPEIKKYKIQWYSGAWAPKWYYPGENDVDWALTNRRVWSYFQDHTHKFVYCPSEDINDVLE
ncbi:hypothetical protein C4566_00880 [Candidatus Parcubacteria bacterium]|nr:MAG: hypothetical protein C4566_00880 [Candidatus Parcubacteria bacterium]